MTLLTLPGADPLFYELAARHLVPHLAALRSGLTGRPSVRLLIGPERQTVRLTVGNSKATGLDWHKDQPCVCQPAAAAPAAEAAEAAEAAADEA